MFHDTTSVNDRIHDLQTTAAELRAERASSRNLGRSHSLRVRLGSAFMAVGSALVNGVSPARISPAGR